MVNEIWGVDYFMLIEVIYSMQILCGNIKYILLVIIRLTLIVLNNGNSIITKYEYIAIFNA